MDLVEGLIVERKLRHDGNPAGDGGNGRQGRVRSAGNRKLEHAEGDRTERCTVALTMAVSMVNDRGSSVSPRTNV